MHESLPLKPCPNSFSLSAAPKELQLIVRPHLPTTSYYNQALNHDFTLKGCPHTLKFYIYKCVIVLCKASCLKCIPHTIFVNIITSTLLYCRGDCWTVQLVSWPNMKLGWYSYNWLFDYFFLFMSCKENENVSLFQNEKVILQLGLKKNTVCLLSQANKIQQQKRFPSLSTTQFFIFTKRNQHKWRTF